MNSTETGARTRRSAQISPDRLAVGIAAVALVTAIMLASYVFSFTAITEAAGWTGTPDWVHPLAAVFIDGAILTYTLSYAIFRWRGQSSKRTLLFLYLFTTISTVTNVAHTAAYNHWRLDLQSVFGMLIAASAPVAALLASEEVTRLALVRMADHDSESQALTEEERGQVAYRGALEVPESVEAAPPATAHAEMRIDLVPADANDDEVDQHEAIGDDEPLESDAWLDHEHGALVNEVEMADGTDDECGVDDEYWHQLERNEMEHQW